MSGNYAPLNAYGGTEFIYRDNYQPFEELSAAEQQFIAAFASAAINNDTAAAKALLDYGTEVSTSTLWNDYKIDIYSFGGNYADDGDRSVSANIEMRSENGTGYIYDVHFIDAVASKAEEYWSDAVFIDRTVCPCTDWQWNGTMSYTSDHLFYQTWQDGSTCNSVERSILSGTMAYGLRDGTFTSEFYQTRVFSAWPELNMDFRDTGTAVYQNGVFVSKSGCEAGAIQEGTMIGIDGHDYLDRDDYQWIRDDLFW